MQRFVRVRDDVWGVATRYRDIVISLLPLTAKPERLSAREVRTAIRVLRFTFDDVLAASR